MGEREGKKYDGTKTVLMTEYYQRPFLLFHTENARVLQDFTTPHPIRNRFWQLIPHGEYSTAEGRGFLNSYLKAVEGELARTVSDLSLAYCLHLYRRLAPGPIGSNKEPHTIGLTRAVLEAAIQKYARFELCNKIAESATIPIEKVLGGLLMAPEFNVEREMIAQNNQLVLTDFTNADMLAFYDIERLAYEIWRIAATLRATGKGAPLIIGDPPVCFGDGRSAELDFLLNNYDNRLGKSGWSFSSTGIVFADPWEQSLDGIILIPTYNLGGITSKDFETFGSVSF